MRNVQRRGEWYHFRYRVPEDLITVLGTTEVKKSLKTSDPTIAKAKAADLSRKIQLLRAVNGGTASEDVKRELSAGITGKKPQQQRYTLSSLIRSYLKEQSLTKAWTEKTRLEYELTYGVWVKLLGDGDVRSIDRPKVTRALEDLSKLPVNAAKRPKYREKTIQELLSGDVPAEDLPSDYTIRKQIQRLGTLFRWAVRLGYMASNPAEGLSPKRHSVDWEDRATYTDGEIRVMFSGLLRYKESHPERFWVPAIGMYSGMRLNEK